jgi:hypothetical protein
LNKMGEWAPRPFHLQSDGGATGAVARATQASA